MDTPHEEMPCQHSQIVSHGKRRRKCTACGKTWTRWKRKRGRKRRVRRTKQLQRTFEENLTVTQQARRTKTSVATMSARHRQILATLRIQSWKMPLTAEGDLILIIDGNWYTFEEEQWTLYLMTLRPVENDLAVFLPPVLLKGKESLALWNQALATMPENLQRRVKAVVSDGIRGVEAYCKTRGWVHQRCHFHLHASFLVRLGRRKSVVFGKGRQQLYQSVRTFVATDDPKTLFRARDSITRGALHTQCSAVFRGLLKEVLRREDEFRAWYQHPELRLPATSNVVESMNAQLGNLERRCHGFKTPKALLNWTAGHIRHHKTMKCQPHPPQN